MTEKATRPNEVHIWEHEGVLLFDDRQEGPVPLTASVTVLAIPTEKSGVYTIRWVVTGPPIIAADALATFFQSNPKLADLVTHIVQVFRDHPGRNDFTENDLNGLDGKEIL